MKKNNAASSDKTEMTGTSNKVTRKRSTRKKCTGGGGGVDKQQVILNRYRRINVTCEL